MISLDKPLLIYDGTCGFCKKWVAHWRQLSGNSVMYKAFQDIESGTLGLSEKQLAQSVWLLLPNGNRFAAALAVFNLLNIANHKQWLLWCYERIPLFARISEWVYKQVALNRFWLSWLTPINK